MAVAEYCGNCDKRTLRKVGPCPECTPKNVESQTTDTQQLKAEILRYADEGIELCFDAGCDERIATRFEKIIAKLSAV